MTEDMLKHKIKTVDELCEAIGPRPREKKVIMCHGTFDLVHPGHVRHLLYAKSKADILVASLTADAHITKAQFPPLRARRTCARSISPRWRWSITSSSTREADAAQEHGAHPARLFRQGLRVHGGRHPSARHEEEIDVLESYGGEIIFTPGDIVYSSSAHHRDARRPIIALEKLLALMEAEGLDVRRSARGARQASKAYARPRGRRHHRRQLHAMRRMIGGMTKTPTLSVRFDEPDGLSSAAPASSPSICAPPAPTSPSPRCSATTTSRTSCWRTSQGRRQVSTRSSIRRARPPTRMPSSPAATGCSRSIRSTTARSPSRSSTSSREQDRARPRRTRSSSAISATACSTADTIPHADRRRFRQGASGSPTARWRAAGATSSTSRASISSRRTNARRASRSATRIRSCGRLGSSSTSRRGARP